MLILTRILIAFKLIIIPLQKISKLKYQNLNSSSHLLLLLSGDTSLNPGPVNQDTLQCLNEWKIAAVIGICESKLDASVLDPEISIDKYKSDRKRQGGWCSRICKK